MAPMGKNRNKFENHALPNAAQKDPVRKQPVKTGLLNRFFAWIARGTNQSALGSTACPS